MVVVVVVVLLLLLLLPPPDQSAVIMLRDPQSWPVHILADTLMRVTACVLECVHAMH